MDQDRRDAAAAQPVEASRELSHPFEREAAISSVGERLSHHVGVGGIVRDEEEAITSVLRVHHNRSGLSYIWRARRRGDAASHMLKLKAW